MKIDNVSIQISGGNKEFNYYNFRQYSSKFIFLLITATYKKIHYVKMSTFRAIKFHFFNYKIFFFSNSSHVIVARNQEMLSYIKICAFNCLSLFLALEYRNLCKF